MTGFILFHYFSSIPELNVMVMTNNSRVFGVALHSLRGWISETADVRRRTMRQLAKNIEVLSRSNQCKEAISMQRDITSLKDKVKENMSLCTKYHGNLYINGELYEASKI